MSPFIESLKRKYAAGTVTIQKLNAMKDMGVLTTAEYNYIVGENQ